MDTYRHTIHACVYSSSLLRAKIAQNHLPFFKIFLNFAHFYPKFQIFWPFEPFFNIFLSFICKIAHVPLLSRIAPACIHTIYIYTKYIVHTISYIPYIDSVNIYHRYHFMLYIHTFMP